MLTGRALADLAEELGGMGAAVVWLLELAEANGKPLGVNLPTGADTSSTAFIAPGTWSRERVQGWIGARHAELEAEFGPVSKVGSELPAPMLEPEPGRLQFVTGEVLEATCWTERVPAPGGRR